MIVMGIDPGLSSTGAGIIEEQTDGRWKALFHGQVASSAAHPMPQRLERIHRLVSEAIEKYRPDVVAIETIFFARNVRSAVLMAHGRGAAILAAASRGIEVVEYSPLEIKQSVVGKGRANKEQVRQMVMNLLAMKHPPKTDHESDALACALCHALRSRSLSARQKELLRHEENGTDADYLRRKAILGQSLRGRRRRGRR